MSHEKMRVFYSWQSDLERAANQQLIRDALRDASGDLESSGAVERVEVDEATRDRPGTPEIAASIFGKIEEADVFVADLSTVKPAGETSTRAFPNPNVTLELGYAAARLGWDRIVIIVNDHFTRVPDDLPFDVRGRRSMRYRCDGRSKSAIGGARGDLRKKLTEALGVIAAANPQLPVVPLTDPAAIRRERDIRTIKALLLYANAEAIDELVESAPETIPQRAFWFQEAFSEMWTATSTRLFDQTAQSLFADVHAKWAKPLSFYQHYEAVGAKRYAWRPPRTWDAGTREAHDADWEDAVRAVRELREAVRALWSYVHDRYVEIDLTEAVAASWREWREVTAAAEEAMS